MKRRVTVSRRIARFGARTQGSATVEFAILFPVVISILMMGAEAGWINLQRVGLDRAVDIAVRDVRLGALPDGTTHDQFRSHICSRAIAMPSCDARLLLELRVIDTDTWQFPVQETACIDLAEAVNPVTTFSLGGGQNIMYLRACYLARPIFPTTAWGLRLPLDTSGMFALRSVSGFVNE
ncbi:TadE-like protein [Roseinatronobacter thiooxidans]|uniref:TadE-like protein n=1 Tax=Roseinatronobacter thiooxidans TaxID=121821 RepID=A0A2W7QFY7_9RHOB|nr:TadE/TadG family type IV pilus assembly protein [Roseinatronobacter thiooxidans]PZX46296.1 TadE-like protein [Roseinatronobacter thiooxidans]